MCLFLFYSQMILICLQIMRKRDELAAVINQLAIQLNI